jgi:hypothetical protein
MFMHTLDICMHAVSRVLTHAEHGHSCARLGHDEHRAFEGTGQLEVEPVVRFRETATYSILSDGIIFDFFEKYKLYVYALTRAKN